jgi:hypothetical protein
MRKLEEVRDDPDLRELALKVRLDSGHEVRWQRANLLFSLMFGFRGAERFTISRSVLAGRLGFAELSSEDEKFFLWIFQYIEATYENPPDSKSAEERDFRLRILGLRWRLGAPLSFAEFVRRVTLKDVSNDPLPVKSLLS